MAANRPINSRGLTAPGRAPGFISFMRYFRGLLAPGYFLLLLTTCVVFIVGCSEYKPTSPPPAPAQESEADAKPAVSASSVVMEKKAAVGVGKKGHYGQGVVATPLGSYFAAREKIAFMIQIPEAMKLFKALEGRAPKDHDEYMEKIIKANRIELPELPDGDRYWYDPETEELMVQTWVEEEAPPEEK